MYIVKKPDEWLIKEIAIIRNQVRFSGEDYFKSLPRSDIVFLEAGMNLSIKSGNEKKFDIMVNGLLYRDIKTVSIWKYGDMILVGVSRDLCVFDGLNCTGSDETNDVVLRIKDDNECPQMLEIKEGII